MKTDTMKFVNSYLHCVSTTGGYRVPRLMGHALHADAPNEIIHFDFLFMGESDDGFPYVLLIKDDASSFVWLEPCAAPDADCTVEVLLRWFASFCGVETWISDRDSHFKNQVMAVLNKRLHAHHHFTTPSNPQSNGTVESICKEVIRAARALLSEFRLKSSEWTAVIRIIQSVLNYFVRKSLNNHAPITAFTGLPAENPLRTLLPPNSAESKTLEFIKAQNIIKIDNLIHRFDDMHRDVVETRTRRREPAIKAHNAETHVHPAQFEISDFVLVAQKVAQDGHKLRLKSRGPRRVTRVLSEHVYEVQDLLTEKHSLIHANRLKSYADSQLDVAEELRDTIEHNNPVCNTFSKLLDLQYNASSRVVEVQTKWRGFSYEEPTWEPFENLREGIPDMSINFMDK